MPKSQRRIVRELEQVLGRGNVVHHPEDLLVYEYDGSIDRAIPQAVVFPTSTEEVSKVVALAHREGMPVVCRGSGTGLSGGAIASLGGLQVVLTRMRGIPGDGPGQPARGSRAGCGEPGPGPVRQQARVALCPRPFQPAGLQPWRQRCGERRRPPLPGLRRDDQPHPWPGGGSGGRYGDLAGGEYPGGFRVRPAGSVCRVRGHLWNRNQGRGAAPVQTRGREDLPGGVPRCGFGLYHRFRRHRERHRPRRLWR